MSSLLSKLDLAVRFHASRGEHHMATFLRNQLGSLRNIIENRKEYLVASYYVPGELLELFDVEVIFMERLSGFAAAWSTFKNPAFLASVKGFPSRGCSYQSIFHLLLEEEMIPKPAGFIALNYACNDVWMYCRAVAEKYKIPFYYIDVPRVPANNKPEYLAKQFEELCLQLKKSFREKRTVKEVITASNEAQKIKCEIDSLMVQNPGNGSIIDLFKLFTLYNDLGKKSTINILKLFKSKIEESNARYHNKDNTGVLWLGMVPLYRNSIISDIEKKLECKIVCEEMFDFGNVELFYDTFYENLAQRITASRFFSVKNRIEAILHSLKNLDIKGIIHFSQRNCRFLPSMVPLIRRKAGEEGIPFVEIHGDVIDPCYFDEKKVWNQLEAFYEQIHRRA